MDSTEYQKLHEIDREHWFYRGKRAIVAYWLDKYMQLAPGDLLVDAGMGTGTWLVEMSRRCRVLGLDDHDESLALAAPRVRACGGEIRKSSLYSINLPNDSVVVVTALDVLEHLDDDRAALEELIRVLRPGGLIIITVPALHWLWSDWDVSLHHRRRYVRSELVELVRGARLELLRCAYFNSAALPAVLAVRFWRRLFRRKGGLRAEDVVPRPIINRALYAALVKPACWSWLQPPIGVSLLSVCRKAGGHAAD